MRFKVGEFVWYVLPPVTAGGPQVWASAVVVAIRKSRIGVRTVLGARVRYVQAFALTSRRMPPADVVAFWSTADVERAEIGGLYAAADSR